LTIALLINYIDFYIRISPGNFLDFCQESFTRKLLFQTQSKLSMRKSLVLLLVALFLLSGFIIVNPVSGADAQDTWMSKASMPTARTYLGAAEVNGKIYAIGGFTNLNNTEEYDPLTDTWTIKAAMPTPRFSFAIAAYQSKIYCIGGLTGRGAPFASSVTGAIEVYDSTTNTWEIKKPMPTARAHLEANVVNDQIYLIGGMTGGPNSTVSTNQAYNTASEKWTTKKPMPYPVASYSSTVVGNKIYIINGQAGPENLNVTQIYDPATDSWTIGTPTPIIVNNHAACTVLDSRGYERIYLIGGATSKVQIFNQENNTWSVGVSILTARDGLAVAVVNNTIYTLGGAGGNILSSGEGYAVNEAYTPIDAQPTSTFPTPYSNQKDFNIMVAAVVTVAALVIGIAALLVYRNVRKKASS
jgi:N-acetylneuraminic acid mutarotase